MCLVGLRYSQAREFGRAPVAVLATSSAGCLAALSNGMCLAREIPAAAAGDLLALRSGEPVRRWEAYSNLAERYKVTKGTAWEL